MNTILQELTQDFAIDMKVWQLLVAGMLPLAIIVTFISISIKDNKRKTA